MQWHRVSLPEGGAVKTKNVGQLDGWRRHQGLRGLRLVALGLAGFHNRSSGLTVLPIVAEETAV
jgi:hypothetical protein